MMLAAEPHLRVGGLVERDAHQVLQMAERGISPGRRWSRARDSRVLRVARAQVRGRPHQRDAGHGPADRTGERQQRVSGRNSAPAGGHCAAPKPCEGGVRRRRAGERGDRGSGRRRAERGRYRQGRRRAERGDTDAGQRSRSTGRASNLCHPSGFYLEMLHVVTETVDLDSVALDRLVKILGRVREPVDVVLHADDDLIGRAPALVEQIGARGECRDHRYLKIQFASPSLPPMSGERVENVRLFVCSSNSYLLSPY